MLRRWRRWLLWLGGAFGVYAALGFLLVPWVARRQIVSLAKSELQRDATVARVRFNPFTWRGEVAGFRLSDRDGQPLFGFEQLVVDLELSGLFRRAWRFREISVQAPAFHLRFLPDGKPSVADLLEPDPEAKDEAFTWPRLIVDRFHLRRGRASLTDASRTPVFVQEISPLELEVADLITIPRESGDHTLVLGLGKDATLRWSGRQTVDPLHLEGRVELRGIALSRVWEYAAPGDPWAVRSGKGQVVLRYDVQRAADGAFALTIKEGSVGATEVRLGPRDGTEDWLELASVEATGIEAAWPGRRITVPIVRVRRPQVLMRFEPDRPFNWARPAGPDAGTTEQAPPWTGAVHALEIAGGTLVLEDRIVAPTVTTTLSEVAVQLRNLRLDLTAPIEAEMTARINGSDRSSAAGTVVPDPFSADLKIALAAIDLTSLQPYSVRLPGAELKSLTAGIDGSLRFSPGSPFLRFEGTGSFTDLQIAGAGEERLLGWKQARLRGVRLTVSPGRLRVAEAAVQGAEFKIHVDKEGNLNLAQLRAPAGEDPAPAEDEAMPIDIAKVVFADGGGTFTDESLILPFGTKIHAMKGELRDFSTRNTAPARLDLEGRVLDEGYFKTAGTLRIADPLAASDINVLFRDVQLPSLTPYSAQFAGYSLQQGMLDLDVRYRLDAYKLVGDHRVIAKDLVLGPKVEGAEGPGLPVRLAVALLKDKQGRIDLMVPVEGSVNSPEFNYRSVFWQAFKTILGNVAKAPFRALGRAFGADDEELELVGFAAGSAELPAPEQDKLGRVAAEMNGREGLSLEIEGRFDKVADTTALKRERLEARIDARRTPETNLDQILEALYAETFSPERLASERLQFETAAATASAATFYEGLQRQLLEAEAIPEADLTTLGRARGEAIASALTAPGGLDATRVKLTDPAPVKRKKQGSDLVPSEMTLTAGD